MAHPCAICGSECYCHGDIDDIIVSKTPKNCDTCGCNDDLDDRDFDDDDEEETFHCMECNWYGWVNPGRCPVCKSPNVF